MAGYEHVDKVDNAEEPTPTNAKEHNKDDDMQNGFSSDHNGKSYKKFHNPVYAGNKQKNCFKEKWLTVKPFVESHIKNSLFFIETYYITFFSFCKYLFDIFKLKKL